MRHLRADVALLVVCIVAAARGVPVDPLTTMRDALVASMLPLARDDGVVAMDREVAAVSTTLLPNGTWADVNYNDPDGRSWWQTGTHLKRSLLLATAWRSPVSAFHNNCTVFDAGMQATRAWITYDFTQSNWWWNDIGTPRSVARLLLLLDADPALLASAAAILDRGSLAAAAARTGCNRVWEASVNVMRGVMEGNATRVQAAYDLVHSTVVVQADPTVGGMQVDGSFHQHGPQLYSGWGYGGIYVATVLALELVASGTPFAMNDTLWQRMTAYTFNASTFTRGPNFDFLASGRLMTYFVARDQWGVNAGHYHAYAAFTNWALALPVFDAPFTTPLGVVFWPLLPAVGALPRPSASVYTDFYARLTGGGPALHLNRHYWTSDYMAHHRSNHTVFLRMFSNRTINSECVNDEGIQGQDLADGVVVAVTTGAEYDGVYPVWDWRRLPGTTEMQDGSPLMCDNVQAVVHPTFTAGVSDSVYGAATMHFVKGRERTLYAVKAWFMFDESVLCLGANITSSADSPVTTSLDQRPLAGLPVVMTSNHSATVSVPPGSNTSYTTPVAVWHGGVAFIGLGGAPLADRVWVSAANQSGSLAAITQGPDTPITMPVFSAFMDHGVVSGGVSASYAYALVPNVSAAFLPTAVADVTARYAVVNNSVSQQAVCRGVAGAPWSWHLQAVVSSASGDVVAAGAAGCVDLGVSAPAVVVLRPVADNTVVVSVSNPLPSNGVAHVTLATPWDTLSCDRGTAAGSLLTLGFPTDAAHAGASVSAECVVAGMAM